MHKWNVQNEMFMECHIFKYLLPLPSLPPLPPLPLSLLCIIYTNIQTTTSWFSIVFKAIYFCTSIFMTLIFVEDFADSNNASASLIDSSFNLLRLLFGLPSTLDFLQVINLNVGGVLLIWKELLANGKLGGGTSCS